MAADRCRWQVRCSDTKPLPHQPSLVVIFVAESAFLPSVAANLYLFAALMVVTTFIHVYLALKYTFVVCLPMIAVLSG